MVMPSKHCTRPPLHVRQSAGPHKVERHHGHRDQAARHPPREPVLAACTGGPATNLRRLPHVRIALSKANVEGLIPAKRRIQHPAGLAVGPTDARERTRVQVRVRVGGRAVGSPYGVPVEAGGVGEVRGRVGQRSSASGLEVGVGVGQGSRDEGDCAQAGPRWQFKWRVVER
jgi:hypothetical protein